MLFRQYVEKEEKEFWPFTVQYPKIFIENLNLESLQLVFTAHQTL